MASLCGCNSIIISQNQTKEDIIGKQPPLKYGVAFGIEEIEEASQTRPLLRKHISQMEDNQIKEVYKYFTNTLNISPTYETSYIL